ncbi:MAG: secretin N-terminal domain-containing protein, partial [Myxococcota bacterium]
MRGEMCDIAVRSSTRAAGWSNGIGRPLVGWLALIALALVTVTLAMPRPAAAQDDEPIRVEGSRPGVIPRGNDPKEGGDKPGQTVPGETNPLDNEEVKIEPNFDPPLGDDKPNGGLKVTIDFRKAELEDVVKFYSKLMKQNFIIADSLKAGKKITIIAPRPVTIQEAYSAFLAALAMNGLTLVKYRAFTKIIDDKDAPQGTTIRKGAGGLRNVDQMETRLIEIEHVAMQDIETVLNKIKSKGADILPYGPTNTLIITELSSNMRRMMKIIRFLDQPTGVDKIHIYQVNFADATELASKLQEIFEADSASSSSSSSNRNSRRNSNSKSSKSSSSSSGSSADTDVAFKKIIADENTNQLIIIANDRSYSKIVKMIEKLDVETNAGRIWLYPLEHANSDDLAGVLSGLTSSNSRNSRNSSSRTSSRTSSRNPSSGGSGGGAGASAGAALLSGEVQVTSEPSTNTLIVVASFKDYLALKTVIQQLDRRRKQVYVEAAIMEISLDRNRQFGLGV